MSNKVRCYICGIEFEGGDSLVDSCPYCDWTYLWWENEIDPDSKETSNPVSINEAKRLVASGKNIWGDPLPKKQ